MKVYNLIVASSQSLSNYENFKAEALSFVNSKASGRPITLLLRGFVGTDGLAFQLACEMGWQMMVVSPNNGVGGDASSASHSILAEMGHGLLAFGACESADICSMIALAEKEGIDMRIVNYAA